MNPQAMGLLRSILVFIDWTIVMSLSNMWNPLNCGREISLFAVSSSLTIATFDLLRRSSIVFPYIELLQSLKKSDSKSDFDAIFFYSS